MEGSNCFTDSQVIFTLKPEIGWMGYEKGITDAVSGTCDATSAFGVSGVRIRFTICAQAGWLAVRSLG